jgi:hypothetical protein
LRAQRPGLGSGGEDGEIGAAEILERSFGDLAASRVACANEEHANWLGWRADILIRATGSTGCLDRHLKVSQLRVDPVEVGSLTFDGRALTAYERHQIPIDLPVFNAQGRQPSCVSRRKATTSLSRARSAALYSR